MHNSGLTLEIFIESLKNNYPDLDIELIEEAEVTFPESATGDGYTEITGGFLRVEKETVFKVRGIRIRVKT
jgi:hypothetical protein